MHFYRILTRSRVALLGLALAIAVGCATKNIQQAPTGRFQLKPGAFNQFSPQQDIQLGQQAAAEVNRTMPVLPDSSPVTQYIQQLGKTLVAHAPGPVQWPFSFHIVNEKDINAFALPGGPIYVNLGTVQAADDEGELAGVLAHEMSHVILRHSTEQASKAQIAQLPLAVLGAVIPDGVGGQLARLGLSFGAQSIFLRYSRDAEREADLLGSQIMYDAGFNPYDMVEFFSKLEKEGGPGVPQFLSDHPNPGNREKSVSDAISKFPKKQYRKDSPQFERIKSTVKDMKPYTAQQIAKMQRQRGAAQARQISLQDVAPSDQFQMLNHRAFQIAYPANWQVYGDQNSTVAIAPQSGVTQSAIGYGVIISGFNSRQGESLEQAAAELVNGLRQSNPELQVAANPAQLTVSGLPAMSVEMAGPSPVQGTNGPLTERDTLVAVQRSDGAVVFMIFIAPEQQFQQFSPAFQQMLSSFRLTQQ